MSMSLFVMGIVAGIALVYFTTCYLNFTTEPAEREMNDDITTNLPEGKQEIYPVEVTSYDDIIARYDAVIEIFKVKEN